MPSVLHDHTTQNNPHSLPFSADVDDAPPGPLTHVIHHGVDAERSPHHKQIVDRQSHTTTNIPVIIMIKMQSRVPVKNRTKQLYPDEITRELLLCATTTKTANKLVKQIKNS